MKGLSVGQAVERLGLGADRYEAAMAELERDRRRWSRLWAYYANPMRGVGQVTDDSERPYRHAQEWGIPARITGYFPGLDPGQDGTITGRERKEVVVENDIAWRVDTMVDYLFGRVPQVRSAVEGERGERIEALLAAVIERNGGVALLQKMALVGAVNGSVDVAVTLDAEAARRLVSEWKGKMGAGSNGARGGRKGEAGARPDAEGAKWDVEEAGRAGSASKGDAAGMSAALGASDVAGGGVVDAGVSGNAGAAGDLAESAGMGEGSWLEGEKSSAVAGERGLGGEVGGVEGAGEGGEVEGAAGGVDGEWPVLEMARLISLQVVEPGRTFVLTERFDVLRAVGFGQMYEVEKARAQGVGGAIRRFFGAERGMAESVVELWSDRGWWRWRGGELEAMGGNSLGRIPVVHIQNTSAPFAYRGGSDVEPLLPLQDQLNTSLSDRAHRIAMESFKMYLGKGMESLAANPPAPGRVWVETNPAADLKAIGGDGASGSEQQHIAEIREAMDKASGVPPVAAGAIRNRIGNLTSAAALRITLMNLLSRTERKRALYGAGLGRMCEMVLAWLDVAGVFATKEAERRVEVRWTDPLPENSSQKLAEAKLKLELGVERGLVLRELGY